MPRQPLSTEEVDRLASSAIREFPRTLGCLFLTYLNRIVVTGHDGLTIPGLDTFVRLMYRDAMQKRFEESDIAATIPFLAAMANEIYKVAADEGRSCPSAILLEALVSRIQTQAGPQIFASSFIDALSRKREGRLHRVFNGMTRRPRSSPAFSGWDDASQILLLREIKDQNPPDILSSEEMVRMEALITCMYLTLAQAAGLASDDVDAF